MYSRKRKPKRSIGGANSCRVCITSRHVLHFPQYSNPRAVEFQTKFTQPSLDSRLQHAVRVQLDMEMSLCELHMFVQSLRASGEFEFSFFDSQLTIHSPITTQNCINFTNIQYIQFTAVLDSYTNFPYMGQCNFTRIYQKKKKWSIFTREFLSPFFPIILCDK